MYIEMIGVENSNKVRIICTIRVDWSASGVISIKSTGVNGLLDGESTFL